MYHIRSTWVDGASYYRDATSALLCKHIPYMSNHWLLFWYSLLLDQSRYQHAACVHSNYHTPNKEIVIGRWGIRECMHSKMLHLLMCSWSYLQATFISLQAITTCGHSNYYSAIHTLHSTGQPTFLLNAMECADIVISFAMTHWGTEVLLPRPFYKHLCMKMVATAFCTAMCLIYLWKTARKIEVLAIE